jgi:hypothetical protein
VPEQENLMEQSKLRMQLEYALLEINNLLNEKSSDGSLLLLKKEITDFLSQG